MSDRVNSALEIKTILKYSAVLLWLGIAVADEPIKRIYHSAFNPFYECADAKAANKIPMSSRLEVAFCLLDDYEYRAAEKVLAIAGDSSQALFGHGLVAFSRGKNYVGEELLLGAAEKTETEELLFRIASVLNKHKRNKSALEVLNRATSLGSDEACFYRDMFIDWEQHLDWYYTCLRVASDKFDLSATSNKVHRAISKVVRSISYYGRCDHLKMLREKYEYTFSVQWITEMHEKKLCGIEDHETAIAFRVDKRARYNQSLQRWENENKNVEFQTKEWKESKRELGNYLFGNLDNTLKLMELYKRSQKCDRIEKEIRYANQLVEKTITLPEKINIVRHDYLLRKEVLENYERTVKSIQADEYCQV